MAGGVIIAFQNLWRDIGSWKVRHRIPARFEEQEHVLTVGDPNSAEAHAHAPAQRLNV